ncbi:MAG: DUF3971 domain-containing protein [Elusimicrobia bacterium]|nr:DUF3971 domain-containing protein [Elusimicrobiota bacterium]
MRKLLKFSVWTAVFLAAAAAAGALALKLYFTQERLKALTTDFAAKNLRRQVTFDSVSLNLSGLAIAGLRVSEYPDFGKGEFFSAASFSVRPSFSALLRGELKVNSVSADGLKMSVREVRPETYNFSDLLSQPARPAQPKASAKPSQAPKLSVSSLKVRGSSFFYTNAAGDMKVTLSGIDLAASGISPDELFPVDASFTLDVKSPYFTGRLPASLRGKVALGGFSPEKGRAEITAASISLGGVKARIGGALNNLLEPDARLRLSVDQFSTSDLKQYFAALPPKLLLPAIDADADFKLTARDVNLRSVKLKAGPVEAAVKGRAAWNPRLYYAISADVKAQIPETDTSLLAKKARQFPVPAGLKLPLTQLTADVRLREGHADVPSFTLESKSFTASGKTFVDYSGKELSVTGRARADVKDLGRLAETAPGLLARYGLKGAAGLSLDYSYGKTLSARGEAELKGAGASAAGYSLSDVSGKVDFTPDSAVSPGITGKLEGEPFTASFKALSVTSHPRADFKLQLSKLKVKELPQASPAAAPDKKPAKAAGKPFYVDVSGSADIGAVEHPNFRCGKVEARLALTNVSDDMRELGGTASFAAGTGKFSGLYKLAEQHKAAKVALYPLLVLQKASGLAKSLRLPDFNNVDFDSIEGAYTFRSGVMSLDKSSLTGPAADVSSSGTINLPAEKLDMRIKTRLKAASGIRMSEPVALVVTGTFSDPSAKPDLKSLVEQPAVKKAVEKLAPNAGKLLKGLFK